MDVDRIHKEGIKITSNPFRLYYCDRQKDADPLRIFSVPKKIFKRAVKRNLVRRRIKEAFRHISADYPLLAEKDCLIVYISNDILDYGTIEERLKIILAKIS